MKEKTETQTAMAIPEILPYSIGEEWILFENMDPALSSWKNWKKIPANVGKSKGKKVTFTNGKFEIGRKEYTFRESALFAQEITVKSNGVMFVGFGADFFFQAVLNGRIVADTLERGNPSSFPVPGDVFCPLFLKKGKNILIILLQAGSNGFTLTVGEPQIPYKYYESLPSELEKTSWEEPFSPCRLKIQHAIRKGVEKMRLPVFETFDNEPYLREYPLKDYFDRHPILIYYEYAMDKLLKEVPQERVTGDNVVIWHLYNMGYIVKTSRVCFGIDLHHRRAELFEPYLDFIFVTHNHTDHQNQALLRKMRLNGKNIHSNFYPSPAYNRGPAKVEEKGDVTIYMEETDHGTSIKKFVMPFLIRCGKGKNALTIYHTGDCGNAKQLDPQLDVDIFIIHPRVSMKVMEAFEKVKPQWVFFSHLMEMGHTQPSIWRPVNFKELLPEMRAIQEAGGSSTIPLWGEKILWNPAQRKRKK